MKSISGQKPIDTSILNGVRGLAALYVLIGHARWLLWEGYSDGFVKHPSSYSLISKGLVYLLAVFGQGHIAVILFFVLSGFVIHYSTVKDINSTINYKDYFQRRFLRIYPPLIFCMLLTITLDSLGKYTIGGSIYFHKTPISSINLNIGDDFNFITALGNLSMLQRIYVPVWGSNGPLWSLMYEWWFYMLYPLTFLLYKRSKLVFYLLVVLIFLLSLHSVFPNSLITAVFNYCLCWYLGVFLAEHLKSGVGGIWLAGPLFLCIIEYYYEKHTASGTSQAITDTLTGFLFTGILYVLLKSKSLTSLHMLLKKLNTLGDFSYTLYLTHVPILVFINAAVLTQRRNKMPVSFIYFFSGIFLSLLAGYFFHFLTEIPFRRKKLATICSENVQDNYIAVNPNETRSS